MGVVGIICEYNPLHLGHERMLRTLRRQGAEAVVCAMSGQFVQRGEPAVVGKMARAEMALRCGADLVLHYYHNKDEADILADRKRFSLRPYRAVKSKI